VHRTIDDSVAGPKSSQYDYVRRTVEHGRDQYRVVRNNMPPSALIVGASARLAFVTFQPCQKSSL
jgi:hypothetical protein